jgi:hypothetical protein
MCTGASRRMRVAASAVAMAATTLVTSLALARCTASPQPAAAESDLRTRLTLSARLLDASDTASAAFENQVTAALLARAPALQIYSYMLSRAEATANIRALALGPDPAGALVDLYVYADLALWACESRARANPTAPLVPCDPTFGVFRTQISAIARECMSADQITKVDAAIAAWKRDHEGQLVVGLMRLSDLVQSRGVGPVMLGDVAPSMFSPVTEAAQQLEEVRVLGYQALWLASRLPVSIGWQADAAAYGVMTSQPATATLDGVSALTGRLSESQRSIEALSSANVELGKRLEAVTGRLGALEKSVGGLGTGLDRDLGKVASALDALSSEAKALSGADTLATQVITRATWSGVVLISLGAASLALVLWSHRHHSRHQGQKSG